MATDGLEDSFGLRVTTAVPACVVAINAYYEAVLCHSHLSLAATVAEEALAADSACPMAQVLAADAAFCQGQADRVDSLLEKLKVAAEGAEAGGWSARECAYAAAWSHWFGAKDLGGGYDALLEVVEKNPADLFAVKRGQHLGLTLRDGGKILAIAESAAKGLGLDAAAAPSSGPRFLQGMWAFGFEQQERYEEAEAMARNALPLEPAMGPDAWLDQTLANALYFQGDEQLDAALEFLESRCMTWGARSLEPSLYTSCWWHLAMLQCEKRSYSAAAQIFDEHLWADEFHEMQGDPSVQLNALDLLWRLETRGQGSLARPRWAAVLAVCQGVTLPGSNGEKGRLQHSNLFLDVLLVRALCVAAKLDSRPLEAWLAAVGEHAEVLAATGDAGGYVAIARAVAELYRTDQVEANLAARQTKARQELKEVQSVWSLLGGTKAHQGVLLEAIEGPVVCGEPEVNFGTLFFD